MRRRLRVGDRVLSNAEGGWKPGEVVQIYGGWPTRMYGVRFITTRGDIVVVYSRRGLRRLTEPRRR